MLQIDKLRDCQPAQAQRLIDLYRTFDHNVDLSDMGTGKTYVASAVANALELPTVVVCPKIVQTAWRRAAAHFGDSFSIINYEMLRTGRTVYGKWENTPPPGWVREAAFRCQCCQQPVDMDNYTPCYCHPEGIHCLITKKREWKYGKFIWNPAVKFAIFDEVHRCGGRDSLNADMLIGAKRCRVKTLGLSATVGCDPLDFKALGYLLDLHTLDQTILGRGMRYTDWLSQHGIKFVMGRGYKWSVGAEKQNAVMRRIRDAIIPSRGVRTTVDQIPGFPEVDISAELYDLQESPIIFNELYTQMEQAILALAESKSTDQCPDNPMTRILRARQEIELLKVPVMLELGEDYRAKGFSVAYFVNFQQTLDEIKRRRGVRAFIDGSPAGVRERQHWMDEFQANREREIVANAAAGGVGVDLHDTDGNFPRVGLVMPGFDAVLFQQLLGRLRRNGGKSKSWYRVLLAANTVEEQVHRNLRGKLNNLDALNNADLMPDNLRLTNFSLLGTF